MSKHVEVTCVAFAETYSQMMWLGCKHAKQGGMKTRVETYAYGEKVVESPAHMLQSLNFNCW